MSIPNGFQADSDRNGDGIRSKNSQNSQKSKNKTTSSRSDALARGREIESTNLARLAAIDERDALAKDILSVRTDWTATAVLDWLWSDDRPWDVVRGAAHRAHDRDIRTPGGLRYVGAGYDAGPTPQPMRIEDWRVADQTGRCPNGAIHDPNPCALCRAGITP